MILYNFIILLVTDFDMLTGRADIWVKRTVEVLDVLGKTFVD